MEPQEDLTSYLATATEQLNDTVLLNIGGTRFEVMKCTLSRFPESKLGTLEHLTHHYRPDREEYYFDRSPFLFDVILNFYRFGELHIPTNLCSESVRKELDYWEISDKLMEDCCWVPYNSQVVKISSLKKFKQAYVSSSMLGLDKKGRCHSCRWYRTQPKVWAFLDDHNSSPGAKAFAILSVMLVLLTTFTFVAETLPELKRNVTDEQRAELRKPPVSQISPSHVPNETTDETSSSLATPTADTSGSRRNKRSIELTELFEKLLDKNVSISELMAHVDALGCEDKGGVLLRRVRRALSNGSREEPDNNLVPEEIEEALLNEPILAFEIIDMIAYTFFTLELLLRIIFCPAKCAFFKNSLNIIDILALVPYYVELVVHVLYKEEKYKESFLDALYVLRIVRIFRIFRMVRHYRGLRVLAYTLKASAREIMLMVIFLSLGMLIFSSLIYYTKGPDDAFTSIPHAFWWAVVTMTTVGYGDMVPKTGAGYLIGSFCALSGVLVISFTVPVIVNNFMLFYQHVEYNRRKSDVQEAKEKWKKYCRDSFRFRNQNGQGQGRPSFPSIIIHSLTHLRRHRLHVSSSDPTLTTSGAQALSAAKPPLPPKAVKPETPAQAQPEVEDEESSITITAM